MKTLVTLTLAAILGAAILAGAVLAQDEKAEADKSAKDAGPRVRLYVEGAFCMGCSSVLSETLTEAGVKEASRIAPNRGRGYVIVLGGLSHEADLGAVAKAVNEAQTPHREQAPPGLALEVFADLESHSPEDVRQALATVEGVDAKRSEIHPKRGALSVRLTGESKVAVKDILAALKDKGIEGRIVVTKVAKASGGR